MDLELEFTLDLELETPLMSPGAPYGMRAVVPCTAGKAKGTRINATVAGPGGDWALVGPDGFGRLDVRLQLQTDDGALLYVTYGGVMEMNEALVGALLTPGQATAFDDAYYRIQLRIETGDERYAWVNQTVFLGRGRVTGSGVAYEVFRVT
jgi:hypothetical protein